MSYENRLYSMDKHGRIYLLPDVPFDMTDDLPPEVSSVIIGLDCGTNLVFTTMAGCTVPGWENGHEGWAINVLIGRSSIPGEQFVPQGQMYYGAVAPIAMKEELRFDISENVPGHEQAMQALHVCGAAGKSTPCLVWALGVAW